MCAPTLTAHSRVSTSCIMTSCVKALCLGVKLRYSVKEWHVIKRSLTFTSANHTRLKKSLAHVSRMLVDMCHCLG